MTSAFSRGRDNMIIDFDAIQETVIPHFYGGEMDARAKAYADDSNRIMLSRLVPGASIGSHVHETNCEIMFVISGTGKAHFDGVEEILRPGVCHYCPMGHQHDMINDGDEDLLLYGVVSGK